MRCRISRTEPATAVLGGADEQPLRPLAVVEHEQAKRGRQRDSGEEGGMAIDTVGHHMILLFVSKVV